MKGNRKHCQISNRHHTEMQMQETPLLNLNINSEWAASHTGEYAKDWLLSVVHGLPCRVSF